MTVTFRALSYRIAGRGTLALAEGYTIERWRICLMYREVIVRGRYCTAVRPAPVDFPGFS